MLGLESSSLKRKLIGLAMTASSLGLIIAAVLMGAYDFVESRKAIARELGILTQFITENVTSALVFPDPDFIKKTLTPLEANKQIRAAIVFDAQGKVFGEYIRPGLSDYTMPTSPGP